MTAKKVERPIVLVVDDDLYMRRRIVRMFHSETVLGVVEADGLGQAADLLEDKHSRFDAVICDLGFPADRKDPSRNLSDGLDLLRLARRLRPQLKLYVLSVNSDESVERDRAKRLKLPVSCWFQKLAPATGSESFVAKIEADLVLPASSPSLHARTSSTKRAAHDSSSRFEFDVFLAHNSKDKTQAERLGMQLLKRGLKPWLDKWNLAPGRLFQEEIEKVIPRIRCVAIICGKSGVGPWEMLEIRLAITQFVRRGASVIPVLLPGAQPIAELPLFLHEFNWLTFKGPMTAKETLDKLEWGITGKRPDNKIVTRKRGTSSGR